MIRFTYKEYYHGEIIVHDERGVSIAQLIEMGDVWRFYPNDKEFFTMNDLTQINDKLYSLNNPAPKHTSYTDAKIKEDVDWP